ncbi:ethanolamine utilization acetate kinase EutQ [Vibrio sp. SCSIO 43137]|uniref:ethanolamine utilization acetate kinase EutQ n=1 Tax=Vibrio sp. SCSIO 43137 TaxID=3021011 RepID=UPI00230813F2|nr:ethanolamine utilization acetate kinase EutQ [Vibrio sp. SCSIO 43137]WCE28610.1 ethanolamine utilization acetate kinase EutQ [Vibrio sp. SCSIO 43137]
MKKLITATDVRDFKAQGKTEIPAKPCSTIVTPEAYDVAKVLGLTFVQSDDVKPACQAIPASATSPVKVDKETDLPNNPALNQIKNEIQSRLGKDVDSSLIDSLIKKALADFDHKAPTCPRQINDDGIVLVRGNTVDLGVFDGAPGKNIGLTDVIGPEQNSTLGVGYMGWENAFFPWTLNYDEVDVILEGELHIKTPSGTTIGKPGDVIFIPKGSDIEFGTPTHVRFVYVAYPADWSEQ